MGKLVLIDGYSLMYRAYHALQAPMHAPDGTPTNAIHGFFMMLLKVIGDVRTDGLAVAFDMHAPTFRASLYDGYKATRKPMPDDLRAQDPIIRELIARMEIPILECEGYEADDILGTIAKRCEDEGREILLVTGDRDSFQLSSPTTTILFTRKGIADTVDVTPDYIRETYGLEPHQLIDVKSLMGDASDNIPGIPGIGQTTAQRLVQTYHDLDGVLERGAAEEKGKLREKIVNGAELARMSYKLAEIVRNAPVETDFDAWKVTGLANGISRFKELGMQVASKKLAEVAERFCPGVQAVCDVQGEADAPQPEIPFESFNDAFRQSSWLALSMGADFDAASEAGCTRLALGGDLLSVGVDEAEALQKVLPSIERAQCVELWNVKEYPGDVSAIRDKVFDVMLAAYALNPQSGSFEAEALCDAAGIHTFPQQPATAIHRLAEHQRREMAAQGTESVYRDIELPLAFVLREMEAEGFCVDADALRALGASFDAEIARLADEIAALAGERINLNSPKQLGEMLFDHMKLTPKPKKTSRGYSTNAEVLEGLAETYPVCAKLLEWRKYQKLRSTYIEPLIRLRDENGRVHTHFDQTGTATGRLSSNEPNLQNIPVRTELGREIRRAFVAKEGCMLIDADYSQIELRLLAHISGDETMIAAFNAGEDIHARTAAEVYGVPIEEVTHAMRSASKAVNFGIVYGISDFALAKNIGVSRWEARDFIDRYFDRYPGVKCYLEESVKTAKEKGYAQTLLGRRRYLPELESANFNVRSFGERCAMNSPIQGTAADIIKLAMIRTADALRREGLRAKLILQVHDELIVEAPIEEVGRAKELLREAMEDVIALRVPLKTDISVGGDWRACK